MRICNLSLDRNILLSGSAVEKRLLSLAEKAGEIVVFLPGAKDESKHLSAHLKVYAVGGLKLAQFFKLLGQVKRVTRLQPFDLITVQDVSFLALIGFCLARRFHIPFEVQVHGLEKFYGPRKLLAGFLLRRADGVRAVSQRLKLLLGEEFKVDRSKIYVLPVYTQIVPSTDFPWRDKKRGPFTFLTVGRLVPVKNISLQIRAFMHLAEEFQNARLVIVGSGPLERRLKSQVKSLKLDGKIIFAGPRAELGRYYKEADAFLLTSDSEGWGLAVTEAAAFGLPVMMTDVGLAGEFIRDGESGIVVPVGDEAAVAAGMKRLIEDGPLRERLSLNVRRAFQSLPSAEAAVRRQVEQWAHFR